MTSTHVDGRGIPLGTRGGRRASERGRRRGGGTGLSVRVVVVAAASMLAFLALGLGLAAGLRCFDVRTPSMGRTAPVGSVVVTTPLRGDAVRVGDVITFRPPGDGTVPYTHRVTAVDGTRISTRGDANAADDAWTVSRQDVVGRVVAVVPGVGWLVRGLPWVVAAFGAVWFATGFVRRSDVRTALRVFGGAMAVAVVVAVLRPFVDVVSLGTTAGSALGTDGPGPTARVVSTGMLPVVASAPEGGSVHLVSGASGDLVLPHGFAGVVHITARLDLTPVGWVLLALVCAVPLGIAVLAGRDRPDAGSPRP